MVHIHRFTAMRPAKERAQDIASVPYDVVNEEEAREIISKSPHSFLRISRSDVLMPDISPYADEVYRKAGETLDQYVSDGLFVSDTVPGIYLYRVMMGDEIYTGMCCCCSVSDYVSGAIRRHELTRYEKEEDRTRHIDTVNANTGPVVLLYREIPEVTDIIAAVIRDALTPDIEVSGSGGSVHQIYQITDSVILNRLETLFSNVPELYIADGHHRAKSAVNVFEKRSAEKPVPEETGRFLGVLFADNEVRVHGYSRLLSDLGEFNPESFLSALSRFFAVSPYHQADGQAYLIQPCADPCTHHILHLYLDGQWYECARERDPDADTISGLDVSYLQDHVLTPLLGIKDPRKDPRLQYLGGARPLADLMARVDSREYMAAIAMQPVSVTTVFAIADAGCVMPPKSTWFEPKLLSGLLIHKIS
ncbi:MAG: DUF1015 domain-containing protein [Methanospirillaceae archaeon]|nr:DUF1015 domain-containing protein [Methanospirillaceae archaeon]